MNTKHVRTYKILADCFALGMAAAFALFVIVAGLVISQLHLNAATGEVDFNPLFFFLGMLLGALAASPVCLLGLAARMYINSVVESVEAADKLRYSDEPHFFEVTGSTRRDSWE
jgi:hypothetical protein